MTVLPGLILALGLAFLGQYLSDLIGIELPESAQPLLQVVETFLDGQGADETNPATSSAVGGPDPSSATINSSGRRVCVVRLSSTRARADGRS